MKHGRESGHAREHLVRTLHLPLADDLHEAPRREARVEHRPATELARDALAAWLHARQLERAAGEIRQFAMAHPGSDLDIDPDLERAGLGHLLARASS